MLSKSITVIRGSNMFRKNGIIAALIIAVIVIVFDIFFLDATVKFLIVQSGSKMAKAKVDIGSLHVDMFQSKITVKNIQVGDKTKEFKNLFSADEAVIDYMLLPLLEKKYIVDNISVVNLSAGSDRKTSGFLKAADIKKIEKDETDYKKSFLGKMQGQLQEKAGSEIKKLPVSKLADIKDIKKVDYKSLFKKEDLASYRAIKSAADRITQEKSKSEQALKDVDLDNKIKKTKESIKKIKDVKVTGISDIPAAQAALVELNSIKKNSDDTLRSVEKAKQSAEAFYEYSKSAYKDINDAKEKDIQMVLDKADIKMLNADSIEKALIGNIWYDRVQKVIYYMSLADKYIPKKKKADKDPIFVQKRGAGREIIYSSKGRYPGFWIKKVLLSVKGADKGSSYYMKGEIHDIAVEQDVTGKPLVIRLELDNPSQEISINATVNHIDSVDDKLEITLRNLPASFIGLDKVDFGSVKIDKAKIGIDMNAHNTDGYFMMKGGVSVTNMEVSSADKQDIAYLAIKGIENLKITFTIKQADTFSMDVSSNAYDQIKKSLTSIYGSKIEKAKQDAKKAVEDAIKGEMSGFKGTGDSAKGSIDSKLKDMNSKAGQIQSEIDKAKLDINKKITGASGKNLLKGLFK